MNLIKTIRHDIFVNNRRRIKFLLILLRVLSVARKNKVSRIIFFPIEILYRIYSEVMLSIEIKPGTQIGSGLRIDHGFGIVINKNAVIGNSCHIRHGVTIGCVMDSEGGEKPSPRLGNNIEIGCQVSIIGDIDIGSHSKICVGSVVISSIPEKSIVAGNSAKVVKKVD